MAGCCWGLVAVVALSPEQWRGAAVQGRTTVAAASCVVQDLKESSHVMAFGGPLGVTAPSSLPLQSHTLTSQPGRGRLPLMSTKVERCLGNTNKAARELTLEQKLRTMVVKGALHINNAWVIRNASYWSICQTFIRHCRVLSEPRGIGHTAH